MWAVPAGSVSLTWKPWGPEGFGLLLVRAECGRMTCPSDLTSLV